MASKSKRQRLQQGSAKKTLQNIKLILVFIFVIKLLIIWRITNLPISQVQGHIWLGADGENYLIGVDGLVKEGFFSKADILNYWPAGYPLVIYLLSFFGKAWALTTVSVLQSLFFNIAIYFFVKEIYFSKLTKYAFLAFLFMAFNPTLSLNSMAVGYESICASSYILIMAIIMNQLRKNINSFSINSGLSVCFLFSFISFLQPRLLVSAVLILPTLIVFKFKNNKLKILKVTALSILLILILPITLILRNHIATGVNTISTNLGVTMNIGAGNTTGGYVKNPPGVPCDINEADYSISSMKAKTDAKKVQCVIKWYLENPASALKLFYNKSIYFWSPWFGPEANGTMARNPWLTVHPFKNMTKTQDGINLLYGSIGKIISWIWLLSGIFLVFYGFLILWRQKFEVRLIAGVAGVIVISSWLVTLISIGDHRFRLPIMGASLFLQAVGIRTLFAGGKPPMVQPAGLR